MEQLDKNKQWARALDSSDYLPGMVCILRLKKCSLKKTKYESFPNANSVLEYASFKYCRLVCLYVLKALTALVLMRSNVVNLCMSSLTVEFLEVKLCTSITHSVGFPYLKSTHYHCNCIICIATTHLHFSLSLCQFRFL